MIVHGMANSQPVIMEINTKTASVTKFISIEWVGTTKENVPAYKTYGSLFYDTEDVSDS